MMRPSLLFTTPFSLPWIRSSTSYFRPLSSLSATIQQSGVDGTITLMPQDASQHTATMILCHGLGDTGDGWVDPAQYLARQLPHVKFILPTAPTQPVTINMGMSMPSWYDIVGLDTRSNEICNGLDESMSKILELIENEVNPNDNRNDVTASPLDYSRIVLGGFSQGGALALYTGMTASRKSDPSRGLNLAGIVLMSGYLPRSQTFTIAPGSESTPILHCHGRDDSMVPVEATDISQTRVSSLVKAMGEKKELYEVKTYPGLDHGVSIEELDDVARFIEMVVPPIDIRSKQQIPTVDPKEMTVKQLREAIKDAGLEEKSKGMFDKSELVDLLEQHRKQK